MRSEVLKRLLDAYSACVAIRSFSQGVDSEGFAESLMIRSAVERQFEIIGEALGKAVKEEASILEVLPRCPSNYCSQESNYSWI